MMPKGCVLLDTSFFIRLLKEDDRLHQNTVEYFKYFLENDYTLKVSTIAISEFCVKGTVDMLPLVNMQILPFNYDHAVNSGPATLKYRLEDEMIAEYIRTQRSKGHTENTERTEIVPNTNLTDYTNNLSPTERAVRAERVRRTQIGRI
jgi:hypothetical protein